MKWENSISTLLSIHIPARAGGGFIICYPLSLLSWELAYSVCLAYCVCVCVVNVGEFYSTCKDKKKRGEGQVYLQGIHFLPNEEENARGRHQTNSAY